MPTCKCGLLQDRLRALTPGRIPAECVKEPGCRELLASMLRETFRMPVYRDHFEWLQLLCEQYVKPTLVTLYAQLKQDKQGDKEAQQQLRKQVKNLVAEASADAVGSCMKEHLARRLFMAQQLQQMACYLQVTLPRLPPHVSAAAQPPRGSTASTSAYQLRQASTWLPPPRMRCSLCPPHCTQPRSLTMP
jgi:hypothetical protein